MEPRHQIISISAASLTKLYAKLTVLSSLSSSERSGVLEVSLLSTLPQDKKKLSGVVMMLMLMLSKKFKPERGAVLVVVLKGVHLNPDHI